MYILFYLFYVSVLFGYLFSLYLYSYGKTLQDEVWAQCLVLLTAMSLERSFSLKFEYNFDEGKERNH